MAHLDFLKESKDKTKLVHVTQGLSILYSRRGSLQGPLSFYRVADWNRRKKSLSDRDWHISRSASRQICILKYVKVVHIVELTCQNFEGREIPVHLHNVSRQVELIHSSGCSQYKEGQS